MASAALRATTGHPKDGYATESDLPLSVESNRQSFISGPNVDRVARAGVAVVISKAERKAIFLDLKPLFAKVQAMYFGAHDDFQKTKDVGQGPAQWPYTFEVAPDFAPTVIKTIDFDTRPTAVRTSIANGVDEAYIATQDGTLHVFTVGGYGSNRAARPSDITEVRTIPVGNNPTCIAYAKHDPLYLGKDLENFAMAQKSELIVVARGDRALRWVDVRAPGQVLRTLTDAHLVDPIWADDNDNEGTESYVVTVADFGGRQVLNYRYGPVIFTANGGAQYGMGADGKAAFELGGIYPVAGYPFQVTGANVP